MSDQESGQEPGDELHIEIEDMQTPAKPPAMRLAFSSFLYPARTARERAVRRLVMLCVVVLALAALLASIPAIREGASGLAYSFLPTPTTTLAPGANRFYLVPNPPGVEVLLDGHTLSRLPLPGNPRPLILARGRHTFTWRSTRLPFQPLTCIVSVPFSKAADTCPLDPLDPVSRNPAAGPSGPDGYVITLHPSLPTLRQERAQGLVVAIQNAVAAARFTATIQHGEQYTPNGSGPSVTATQPLRATLGYASELTGSFLPEPCAIGLIGVLPCRFSYQDCSQICTLSASLAARVGSPKDWIAGIGVRATWTYTPQEGRVIGQNYRYPDPSGGVQLVLLRIGWDGAQWHVAPIFGHHPALPASDDAACDTALFQLVSTTWSFMLTDPPPEASLAVASGATPADGCVVVVRNHGTPAPVFLERFGVLLAVNDAAWNPTDNLPMANAAEQAIARQLMAQLQS